MGEQRCENCRFWESGGTDEHEHWGLCFRFPPSYIPHQGDWCDTESWRQPHTESKHWCGEWENNERGEDPEPALLQRYQAPVNAGVMARMLGVKSAWLKAEAEAGRVPGVAADNTWLFIPADVERVMARRAREHQPPEGEGEG